MKKFLESLLSSNGKISSKRFTAIFALINLVALTWLAAFYNVDRLVPAYMFDALVLLSGGTLAITGAETIMGKKGNSDSAPTGINRQSTHPDKQKELSAEDFPSSDDTPAC